MEKVHKAVTSLKWSSAQRKWRIRNRDGWLMDSHTSWGKQLLLFIQHCLRVCVCVLAHQNRVSDMVFSLETEWVVSTGHDKSVSWMCTQSGSMLGRHFFNAWASCLQYPSSAGRYSLETRSPNTLEALTPPRSGTTTKRSTPSSEITQDRSRCWSWRSRPTPPSRR